MAEQNWYAEDMGAKISCFNSEKLQSLNLAHTPSIIQNVLDVPTISHVTHAFITFRFTEVTAVNPCTESNSQN